MTEQEFVDAVMARQPAIPNDEWSQTEIGHLFERGFSLDDAVHWMNCTEEVNPLLDEETALRRLHAIDAKYPRWKGRGF